MSRTAVVAPSNLHGLHLLRQHKPHSISGEEEQCSLKGAMLAPLLG